MRYTLTGSVFGVMLGIATGCDTIIAGNFEEWPVALHNGPIPGDPEGDRVAITAVNSPTGTFYPGGVAADMFWFRDTVCPTGTSCSGPARVMWFESGPVSSAQANNDLSLIMNGDAFLERNTTLDLLVFDGHFQTLFGLRFSRGSGTSTTVSVVRAGGTSFLATITSAFSIVAGTDVAAGTVSFSGEGDGTFTLVRRPSSTVKGISLAYSNPIATASTFRLDDISLSVSED